MLIKTLINGKAENKISVQDRGLQFGDGLFETLAISQNTPLCFAEHYERLKRGGQSLAITIPDRQLLQNEILSLIDSSAQAVLKIIITRGQGGRGYAPHGEFKPNRIISLYQWPEFASDIAINGVRARFCQYRYQANPELSGIKHLNRLEQIKARSEWQDDNIAEGIVCDQNENVIEGTMSNLFFVKENELYTPDLSQCGVEGVVRQKIIESGKEIGLKVSVTDITRSDLQTADEIFVCNSVIGIWPINCIDDEQYKPGQITQKLRTYLIQRNIIC